MKVILLLCLALFVIVNGDVKSPSRISQTHHLFRLPPPTTESKEEVDFWYFTQKLDHFNSSIKHTWKQRYYVNTNNFNSEAKNVAFLILGGEGEAGPIWMTYGSRAASARKYGAIIFLLEHRFYGYSQPFSDWSLESLRFLSSEQALGDAANFIEGMNVEYSLSSDVKWIVVGGSYSGALSAWTRLKYPNLVHGAISSSGPLFAKLDFFEYFQVVTDNLNNRNKECVNSIKTAMEQINDLISAPNSSKTVTNLFNLCEPIEGRTGPDVDTFYNYILDAIAATVQYSEQGGSSIDDMCDILTDSFNGTEAYRLSTVVKSVFGSGCLNYNYADDVAYISNITLSDGIARQWYYQTCNEFGWYQTTDRVFVPGCNSTYYINLCNDVFGLNETYINEKIDQTNINYGGTDINVTNVVFVHGSLDPWHAAGLIEASNSESPVIYIEGASHCADMYNIEESDLPQVVAAKEKIDTLIGAWLGIN